jgi:hypothetical protein
MRYKRVAKRVYKKFSSIEGNQYIAGDYALETILKIVKDFKINKILEVGLGIGSISEAILLFSKEQDESISYYGTEDNEFCLKSLPHNVTNFNEIRLFSSINDLPKSDMYDLVIIDGSDDQLFKIKDLVTKNGLIYIEGGRKSQVNLVKKTFPTAIVAEIISMRPPTNDGPFSQKWSGGGSLIFTTPNFIQKIYCFKEKVNSYYKRRMRKFTK